MSNQLKTRNGIPFDFVDGLRIKGVDVTNWDKVFIDQGASYVGFQPVGNLAASNVQAAIAELESEKQSKSEPITTAINLRPGANQGVVWDIDAFGGGGDSASITLETAGGEATKMRFKMTNDADDNFEFTAKTPDGLTVFNNAMTLNGNVILNAANYVDYAAPMISDYSALRAYAGNASQVRITSNGLAGFFYYDASDTTSVDNGGTIIVSSNGKRWKRLYDGAANVKWFGAKGDWNGITGTDDTLVFQAAIDYLESVGGGGLLVPGQFLIGGVDIDSRYITIFGRSENDKIIVKNGTTGIRVKQHWVNFRDLTIKSQGTKSDGLGTVGINYQQITQTSIGYVQNENLTISGFSGTGLKVNNAINFVMRRCYIVGCEIGVHLARDGTGAGNFSTTVTFDDVYVTSCATGIKGDRVYRSRFNVTGEYCTYSMDMSIGAFTLFRCYFENNTTLGARIIDCEAQDLFTYSNGSTDAVSITFTGATAAADRGYTQMSKFDTRTKRLGVLSQYGTDLKYLDAHGTTSNTGLKYGNNTVALVRGVNLFNESSWVPNRIAELVGWDLTNQGYKIIGTTAGDTTYGMKQDLILNNTKTYVIDLKTTTVSGTGITLIKVGPDTVTNGVPFTPTTNGVNTIKCYGFDTIGTAFECYVNVFTIAEVSEDSSQIAEANSRLTRIKGDRGVTYAAAAPSAGYWMQGEVIYNTAPVAGGFVGWVCVTTGAPGTWKTFGVIAA